MTITATTTETLVNTTTAGNQTGSTLTRLYDAGGIFIGTLVVWVSDSQTGGEGNDIVMQRYDAAGAKVGAETIVNTTLTGNEYNPTVTALAGGMYAVAWEANDNYGRGSFVQVYTSAGVKVGDEIQVANSVDYQYEPQIVVVSGGFLVSYLTEFGDANGRAINAQRFAITGSAGSYAIRYADQAGTVLADQTQRANFLVNQSDVGAQQRGSSFGLASGGALYLYESPDSNGSGLFGRIMAANGTLGAEFHVSSEGGSTQAWGDAVQLANGNIFVSWASNGQDGRGYGVYGRILTATGAAVSDEFRMNEEVPGNQSDADTIGQGPKLALLDDGSVVGVWYTDSDNYTEVLARRFKADGSPDGHQIEVNVERFYYQLQPDVVAIAGGFRVTWSSLQSYDYDIYSRDFTYSGSIPTTQPVQRTGGEDQVNTGAIGDQENAQVISRADGSYVVTWASQTNLSTGDGSGWGLFGQRYSAAGARVGGEFALSQTIPGDQYYYNTAMLSDGRFVVTWHQGGESSESDTYYRIFNANGSAATNALRANANAGQDYVPRVAALSTGGFVIAWNTYYYNGGNELDSYAQQFDAAGVAIGTEFRMTSIDAVNTSDGNEGLPTLLGLNAGKYVVVYEDRSGQDGDGYGLYGRIYDAAGVGGTTFQINAYTASTQQTPDLAKFANGSFVVVWNSYGQDTSADGIYARVFDANGVALTDEIRINSNRQYGQYAPQVAVLADGSFAVTWSSDHDDGFGSTDVYVARYSATGQMLNEDVRINREVSAHGERYSDIAATENGFVITWTQQDAGRGGADGDQDGIFRQEFMIDGLNASAGERADRPSIGFGGGTNLIVNGGAETGTAATNFTAVVNPAGWTAVTGSMTAVQYAIGGTEYLNANDSAEVTGGNDYFAGGPNSAVSTIRQTINVAAQATQIDTGRIYARLDGDFGGFYYDNDTTAMTVIYRNASGIELGRRTIGPVQHYERGYVTQLDHRSALSLVPTGTRTIDVELAAVRVSGEYNDGYADNLSLVLAPAGVGSEDSPIAIPLVIALQDANTATAETLRVEIAGIPVGAVLSDGVRAFTATRFVDTVDITGWTRSALTITPPANSEADFTLEIRATATETATGDTATSVRTITIDVQPTAEPLVRDAPTVRVNAHIPDQQTEPHIARDAVTGHVVVTWQSHLQDGSGFGVYMQLYTASGALIGGERQIAQTTANEQTDAVATYLPNGQFVVVWTSTDTGAYRVMQRLFNGDGSPVGAEQRVDNHAVQYYYGAPFPDVTTLADDGWLTSWSGYAPDLDASENGVYAQRYNAAGLAVTRDGSTPGIDIILVNTVTERYQDEQQIVGTADGGWIAVYSGFEQDGDPIDGIFAQRFSAAGAKIGAEFHVNQFVDNSQRFPQIAVLTNGNLLMTWMTDSALDSDASGYGISARLYSATGVALTDEFAVNADKANNQTVPTIAAMADGAFAIAWQDDFRANGHDIALQLFDAEGNRIGEQATINSQPSGYDYAPSIVYDGVGFTAVWADDNIDGSSQGIAIRRISLPSDDVAAVGGARVVPTQIAYNQSQGESATLADGSYVVVWTSAPNAGAGDVSGYGIRAQRFSAAGVAIGGEFSVNSNVAYTQTAPSITALDGGGYVIVWDSETGDGSGYGIFAQRYDAAGARIGGEFQINADPSGTQIVPDVAALHGAQAGGFAVTWEANGNVFARAFDAAGTAIGSDLRVDQAIERVSSGDNTESEARIAGDATGGFTIVFQDYDGDKNSWAVIGQRYAISGGTVSAIGGTNSDGSTSPSNFRVNTGYYGGQYQPDIVTLADGGFVVAWYSDDIAGVQAQVYNANGSLRGAEFNLDGNAPGYQYEPSIAALADGGFVAVWRDDNGNYSDVLGARFSASGVVLDRFTVNAGDWYQSQAKVVAQGDGFNVVFSSNGAQDGFGAPTSIDALGVLIQHFAIDSGAGAGENIAQRPTLTLGASVTGAEDAPIALSVAGALNNSDGGSETLRLVIENLPAGARLSDGVRSFTAMPQAPAVDVTGWTLSALTLTPPRDFNGTFTLNLRATATEAQGDTAYNTGTIQVNVTPVDELLPDYGAERQDNAWTSDQQWYPSVASQADGSYLVVWMSQSQPGLPYYSVMAQRHDADGAKIGSEFAISEADHAFDPEIVALADGTYLIAYQGSDTSGYGISLQRLSATGAKLAIDGGTGTPVPVMANTTEADYQYDAELTALSGGGWAVVWRSEAQDGSSGGVYAQRFAADGTRVGTETRVNVTIAGDQNHPDVAELLDGSLAYSWAGPTGVFARVIRPDGSGTGEVLLGAGDRAAIEALPNGTFVVAWQANGDIYGQRLNGDGSFAGSFFRINSYAYDQQLEPAIAVLPDGGYMVTWSSHAQDGSSWGVYGQRYDSLGAAVGTEFRVNRTIAGDQSTPAVVAQGDGSGLIVAYEGQDGSGYGIYNVRLPLPDASTPPAIAFAQTEQQVNDPDIAAAASYQNDSSVTKLADGSYIVTYSSYNQDESGYGIYVRHYEADGDAILWNGTDREKLINLSTSTDQYSSVSAAFSAEDGGGFVVVYQSNHDYYGIYARRYDAAGSVVQLTDANGDAVDELRISAPTTYSYNPAVSVGSDGAFTVTFMSDRDGQSFDIHAHTVDATGQLAAGGDIRINQNVDAEQNYVSMTALAGGGHVATWHSAGHDGSSWGIYARMLDAAGQPIGNEFLINTYTDSEQSHPSVAALTNGGFVVVWNTTTGYDTDDSGYGIAGQRYTVSGGVATRAGGEFVVNGIAANSQIHPYAIGTQDGGFIAAWRSEAADNSSYAIAGRRFDSAGNATEPYGNDFIINTTTAGDQSDVRLALLDRGFVATWTSDEALGTIRMQRFEGAGLEPPPYVVDPLTGNDTNVDKVYATIQQALDAALADGVEGQTILIRGGTYTEALTVQIDDLKIVNAAGETVIIRAPSGAVALQIAQNLNLTIRGDAATRLVFEGAAGQDTVRFLGNNDGSEITKATVASAATGQGLVLLGGQDGITVQDNVFTGANTLAALGANAVLGLGVSSNLVILRNAFTTSDGFAISSAGSVGRIVENVFGGSASLAAASVVLTGTGTEVAFNRFQAGVGPHFRDAGGVYDEAAIIAGNAFPEGHVRLSIGNVLYSTIAQALQDRASGTSGDGPIASGTVLISGGTWTEGTVTVPIDGLTVSGPGGLAPATGVSLLLGTGAVALTLEDAAPIDVTGNTLGNVIVGNAGANVLTGLGGNDFLFGGGGADTLIGGIGSDQFRVELDGSTTDIADGGADVDQATFVTGGFFGSYTVSGDAAGFAIRDSDGVARATATGVENALIDLAYGEALTVGALPGVSIVFVSGGSGNNLLTTTASTTRVDFRGEQGDDTFIGGTAFDVISYSGNANSVIVNLGTTAITVGANTVAAGKALDPFGYTDTLSGIDQVQTGDGNDTVQGGAPGEMIFTFAGNDSVNGGGGNDQIHGGIGTNALAGGAGSDFYYIESATDTITEAAGAANGTGDTVVTALATYSIASFANVENLEADSDIAHTFTGNTGANRIVGGAGGDTLNGGNGDDILIGGLGNDTLNGGANYDVVNFSESVSGVSVFIAGSNQRAISGGDTDTLAAIEKIIGSAFDDSVLGYGNYSEKMDLDGGAGNDILSSNSQADVIDGGLGTDTYVAFVQAQNGLLTRIGSSAWTFNGSAGFSTDIDTLRNIESIQIDDSLFISVQARSFAIVDGNIAVQSTSDARNATEAGGVANGTAAVNATGNVLSNDINLDQSAADGDVMKVATIAWTSATGPGSGTGTGATNVAASGNTVINGRYGTLTLNAAGGYTYTPDATKSDLIPLGTIATEVFTYTASDGIGAAATATLTIALAGRNDAPVVANVALSGSENAASIGGTLTGTDVDTGATLTFARVAGSVRINGTSVADGTVTVNANGSYSYVTGAADQALNAGETRVVTFDYVANDGIANSVARTVTLTVTGANDAPVAVADTGATTENAAITTDVLANDTDIDTSHVFTLVSAVTALSGKGAVSIVANQLVFTPGTAFDHLKLGAFEDVVVNYTMRDDQAATSASTLTIRVTGTNDAPAAVANVATTGENTNLSVNVLANDVDVDDDAVLTLVSTSIPAAKGTASIVNNRLVFVPGAAFDRLSVGASEVVVIGYTMRDENNATSTANLTITVTGVNDAPVAIADTASGTENQALLIDVLANDTDRDDIRPFTLVSVSNAGAGGVSIVDNKLAFAPGTAFDHLAAGVTETVTLGYVMRDDQNAQATGSVTVTITGTNDAPVAIADTGATTENAAVSVNVLANDTDADDGAVLTLVSATAPAGKGSASVSGGGVTFTPGTAFDHLAAGVTDSVAIGYVVRDAQNATANGTLTITVTGTNDAPIAVADTATTGENTVLFFNPLTNDTDVDDGAVLSLVSVTAPAGKGAASVSGGQIRFAPGTVFDHLAAGASEVVTLTYVMRDQAGVQSSSTVAVTVTGVNDAPVPVADTGATTENAAVTVNVLANDSDVDDGAVLTLVSATAPVGKGSASVSGGSVIFTPGTAFDHLAAGATETVAIGYVVRDAQNASVNGTLTITVTGTNDAPVAVADAVTTGENTVLLFNPLINDTDADDGAVLTLVSATGPAGKGVVSVTGGQIRFAPGTVFDHLAAGASEVVTLAYVVRDQTGAQTTGSVALTVTGVNDRPVAPSDTAAVLENQNVLLLPLANDSDVDDGARLTITNLVVPEGRGTGTIIGGNRISYLTGTDFDRLAPGDTQTVVVRFDIIDGQGGVTPSFTTVTVTGTNDRPRPSADTIVTQEDTVVTIPAATLLANDRDIDVGQTLTITGVRDPVNGSVTLVDGVVTFVPTANFAGRGSFFYTVADGAGGTTDARASIVIKAVADPGVAQNDAFATTETASVSGNLFADNGSGADVDVDSALRVGQVNGVAGNVGQSLTLASGARLNVAATGAFTYNPNGAFAGLSGVTGASNTAGSDSFTYGLLNGGTATVTIAIAGVSTPGDRALGTTGNDAMTGGSADETFMLNAGGNDNASGLGGDDDFYFGAALTAADIVDGGAGSFDEVIVQGNYTALNLTAAMFTGIEALSLLSGLDTRFGAPGGQSFSYVVRAVDANVGAGQTLTVAAAGLQAGENVTFNGSLESDGAFIVFGGRGTDLLTGGAGADVFLFGQATFGASDRVIGGGGVDTLALQGDYTLSLGANQLSGIETILAVSASDPRYPVPGESFGYALTLANANVTGTLAVDGAGLTATEVLNVDGRLVTGGTLVITGGASNDVLVGGARGDTISGGANGDTVIGGLGADILSGGAGSDVLIYSGAADSTRATGYDTVIGFDFAADRFDVTGATSAYHRDASVGGATLSSATFDAQLQGAVAGVLTSGGATFVTATAGTLSGHMFLVVDQNGVAGYQAGADLVIDIVSPVNVPATGVDFLI